MVPEEGRSIGLWLQQDTSRVVSVADTVVKRSVDAARRDTVVSQRTTPSLDNLEELFQQTDRRLKKDSVAAVQSRRRVVKKKVVKKKLQEPADSVFLMQVTSHPPGNTPQEIIARASTCKQFLAGDSTREYRPLRSARQPERKETVEVRPSAAIAIKREPAFLRENWILGVLILTFLLITWTKIRFGKLLNQTFSALWNYKNANTLFRNKSSLYQGASFLLTANFLLTTTLFIYFFLKTQYPEIFLTGISHIRIYVNILLVVAGVSLYLLLVIWVIDFITLAGESFKEYGHFTKLFFHNIGLYLFPLTAIIPYVYKSVAAQLLQAGLLLLVVIYLFRVVKLISIFIRERFSIFFMILYLCTLEILPVAILLKYLSR